MTQQVGADIYGKNGNNWDLSVKRYFPTQGISIYPAPMNITSLYGIYLLSVVKLLTEEGQPEYLTNKSVVQLATEANT